MRVSVVYALPVEQWWLDLDVVAGTTIAGAIHQSGLLDLHSDINLNEQKVGIFGKLADLDQMLSDGDRVEIYRKIQVVEEDDIDDDGF